jgi:hypothetical protein
MKVRLLFLLACVSICLVSIGDADGRGFGGFRGGSFGAYHYGGYDRSFDYSGARSYSGFSGWNRGAGVSDYDRSWTGSRGGSINTEGARGYAYSPFGAAAGGRRETTVTTPEGRTYSGSRQGGAAVGAYGRTIGGGERSVTGAGGTVGWRSAYAGTRFPTDLGLAHYSSFHAAGIGHSTAYWSGSYVAGRAGYVRTNFGYYNSFHPAWYTAHPGCWVGRGRVVFPKHEGRWLARHIAEQCGNAAGFFPGHCCFLEMRSPGMGESTGPSRNEQACGRNDAVFPRYSLKDTRGLWTVRGVHHFDSRQFKADR